MAGTQPLEGGEVSPCSDRAPDPPSSPQSKRNITPRGPLFPNFDEAHRKITTRAAAQNPFERPSEGSQSSPDLILQELASDVAAIGIDGNETPEHFQRHAPDIVAPQPSRLMAGRSLTQWQNNAKLSDKTSPGDDNEEQIFEEEYDHRTRLEDTGRPDTTGSTVGRIVGRPLPRIPTPSASDAGDADWLTEAGTTANLQGPDRSLMPLPLRLPSSGQVSIKLTAIQPDPVLGDPETSAGSGLGAASTSSHGDPFVYDNERYKRIRQAEKEREVSCLLKDISESPERGHSIAGPQKAFSPAWNFAEKIDIVAQDSNPQDDSNRPRYQTGSFYDPVAFRALHGDVSPNDQDVSVKVVINKRSDISARENRTPGSAFGLSIDRRSRMTRSQDVDGDWVTEATSDDDIRMEPGSRGYTDGIKATGSSIADYSDAGFGTPFPQFGSQDTILKTPSGQQPESYEMQDMGESKQAHAGRLPRKPRFDGFGQNNSRFLPKVSGQMNLPASRQNPFRRDYLRADPSSYFSSKADRNGPSRFEFRDSASTYAPAGQAIGETRGTLASSTMASIDTVDLLDGGAGSTNASAQADSRMASSHADHQRGYLRATPIHNLQQNPFQDGPGEQDQGRLRSTSNYSERMGSGSSKFSFRLLDLGEAQELERSRRDSDATYQTASVARNNRSFSAASSGRPSLTPLLRPSAAVLRGSEPHVRRGSRLSSTFTPPAMWNTLRSPDTSGCTPLDASASRLMLPTGLDHETPTARRRPNQLQNRHNRILPVDKRMPPIPFRANSVLVRRNIPSFRATEEYFVSSRGRVRSQIVFYVIGALSILPFVALLALCGKFDSCLASVTHGEVCRLNHKQRKILKIVFAAEAILYGSLVVAIIVYFATLASTHH
ncbi:hypothetical protein KJ359_009201 [Pestalotiopsis sp. 9143b]|nr:hypothetical protein KJ359_009201 [Pestalotiopsis sp. 9143b]